MSEVFTQCQQFLNTHKKTLVVLLAALVLAAALGGVFHRMYDVEGVVSGVSGNRITVTDFWGSRIVSLDQHWLDKSPVKIGDRIDVAKNLQGQIYDVRIHNTAGPGQSPEFNRGFPREHHR